MANVATQAVARQIESLYDGGSVAGLTDRQLLGRFVTRHDAAGEDGFAALVARHGPMVMGVCRQLLVDRQHAEDAFQAVFLVLARRARSVRDPDLLSNWLYGIALRTARKVRARLARQRRNEEDRAVKVPDEDTTAAVDQAAMNREQAATLHEEINRLPGSFRVPVVLCYFEGLTLDQAARRLRCPAGTIHSRLARARDRLRRGLTRRGVVLPAAALAVALGPRSAAASVSSSLCEITTRAAVQFAAGHAAAGTASVSVTALAPEVLRSMLINHVKIITMTLLFVGVLATGAGFLSHSLAMKDEHVKNPAGLTSPLVARPDPNPHDPPQPTQKPDHAAPGRMTVAGRVLDPDGKPVAKASVDLIGRPRTPWVIDDDRMSRHVLLGRAETNNDGRFRLDAARTASTRFFEVHAVAAVPGFGLGWAELNPDADQPAADIALRPEQVIRGKLVDLSGRPAAGVELRIGNIGKPTNIGSYDGVSLWDARLDGMRVWPRPVTTDHEGRFTLAGIGRDLTVNLDVYDLRFARQGIQVKTDARDGPIEITQVLRPATIIEGRVLAADTGQPIPGAVIAVAASRGEDGGMSTTRFLADEQGRFTVNPSPGDYFRLNAHPPDAQPYLVPQIEFAWTKGAIKKVVDVKLPRGISIRGKVTDAETGKPLTGASVQYIPAKNPRNVLGGWQAVVASKDDGSYQIVVPPGKGHLFVYGPTADYVLETIGERMVSQGQPGGERYYAHDIIAYEVKSADSPHAVNSALRPGKTVKGRLVGPDGQTVEKAEIIATLHFNYFHLNWRGDLTRHARDGDFEVHGLDPEKPSRVSFLDSDHQWGATLDLSGKQAGEDLKIRLAPCGQAKVRFVGPDGKPLAKHTAQLELVATPGPHPSSRTKHDQSELAADSVWVVNLDRKHYWNGLFSDALGRVTLPDLVPGALYRISDSSTINVENKGVQVRKDFTVKPGETLDLGDILIEKPQ